MDLALKKVGIHKIQGAVIADESIFDTEGTSFKWVGEDMGSYYAPEAMDFAYSTISIN